MAVSANVDVNEIACQQNLTQDGFVYSVQWMVVPDCHARLVTAELLLARYLKLVRDCTLSLVRPAVHPDGIEFRLLTSSLAFLRFAAPEYLYGEESETVQLRTVGGLLVRAGEPGPGRFSLSARQEAGGVRITVQLLYCRPLLLGSANPPLLPRRLLFGWTQGRIHKAITIRFLADLYRELMGGKARIRVRQVQMGEGKDI
jgi:hypothetical protein